MKRIFTLFVSAFFFTMVMGQVPTGVIKKATVAPVIDGEIDAVWADANVYNIDKPYTGETPTIGASGTSTWQALWDAKGIYLLVTVNDNVWAPAYGAASTYLYDHPEIYFNANFDLLDGKGPQADGNGGGNGHHQFAPNPIKDSISGGVASSTSANGAKFCFKVTDPSYVVEYFFPFTRITDNQGIEVDQTGTIGFDVTICDNDIAAPGGVRNRAVWANVGANGESWVNMNDCGTVTLEGAVAGILVDKITVAPATITTDNGTAQMVPTITPVDATNQTLKWTIENGTGKATISATGLVTAIENGTVTVKADATDGNFAQGTAVVTITGQILNKYDVWNSYNLLKNWSFDTDVAGWGNYVDNGNMVAPVAAPVSVDGVAVMEVGLSTVATEVPPAAWHYQFLQQGFSADPNVPYTLYFKTWATSDAPAVVDFESASGITPALGGDQYVRYGASSDPGNVAGRSEWNYTITTVPTWFTYHVTFDQIIATTIQKVQFMYSLSNATISMDSVLIVKDTEFALRNITAAKTLATSFNKVYPNPVGSGNTLYVELSSMSAKVSIYNALGQKLMEKVATGNLAKFDVSSLQKGMYFVRLSDGTTQKFVK